MHIYQRACSTYDSRLRWPNTGHTQGNIAGVPPRYRPALNYLFDLWLLYRMLLFFFFFCPHFASLLREHHFPADLCENCAKISSNRNIDFLLLLLSISLTRVGHKFNRRPIVYFKNITNGDGCAGSRCWKWGIASEILQWPSTRTDEVG